ncbi:MAG: HAD family phosphatase [Bacteroidales bacterium]|jgi:2-haloacid dehalogenase|nr:HAD family phosphatase [Bacteroidales bacterium]
MIKNIIFDFGGVLVDWNPEYLYSEVFDNREDMDFFLSEICNSEWNTMQDAGQTLAKGTELLTQKYPEYSNLIKMYYGKWEVMLKDKIEANTDLLPLLKNNYRLFGLTNWSAETFPIALNRFSFFKLFEGIVVSGEEKLVKPDRRIFDVLLNRYNIKANESLFIDDNSDNIIAADKLGFKTIHYSDIDLKEQLTNMNIL